MNTIDINSLTIGDAKQLAAMFGSPAPSAHPYQIGKAYQFRTATMIDTGIVKAVYDQEIVIAKAAWIADTGRFSDAVADPERYSEVEPFPDDKDVIIGRGSIIDAVEIKHAPRTRK